jgi:hypothetical protein
VRGLMRMGPLLLLLLATCSSGAQDEPPVPAPTSTAAATSNPLPTPTITPPTKMPPPTASPTAEPLASLSTLGGVSGQIAHQDDGGIHVQLSGVDFDDLRLEATFTNPTQLMRGRGTTVSLFATAGPTAST